MSEKQKIISVVGPTASGKTSLAVELAKIFDGEVISADSMQIYQGMQIATAKPDKAEMQGIPHHLMDFLPSDKSYSVAMFTDDAKRCITDISSRGKLPVLAGGTGLYVDSLLRNIKFSEEERDEKLSRELWQKYEEEGIDSLLQKLSARLTRRHMSGLRKAETQSALSAQLSSFTPRAKPLPNKTRCQGLKNHPMTR